MNNLEATVFVYRHKTTKEIRCEYGELDETHYDHIVTLEPRLYIQFHYDDQEKFALLCEKLGMEGYGSLAIAAAIRQ